MKPMTWGLAGQITVEVIFALFVYGLFIYAITYAITSILAWVASWFPKPPEREIEGLDAEESDAA
jgi:hypothetical protein